MANQSSLKFRKAALANQQNADNPNQPIQLTPARTWLIIAVIWLVLIGIVIWSIVGSIPTRAVGPGILVAENGGIYNAIAPAGSSEVEEITVKLGQTVNKGAVIAYLNRPELVKQIQVAQDYVQQYQTKYNKLKQEADREIAERLKRLQQERQTLERSLATQTENLASTESLLNTKREAFKNGIITKQDVAYTERDYYATKLVLEQTQNQLIQSRIDENNYKNDWQQRLHAMEIALTDKQQEVAKLQAELTTSRVVISPFNGVIASIHVAQGNRVNGGFPIISIAEAGSGLDAIAFIPPQFGQQVKANMEAFVVPIIINKEEFGSMKGQVTSSTTFPSTPESMLALLHNESLVKEFTQQGSPVSVRIQLNKDNATFSGYQWTSSQGPQQKISPGMLVNVQVTVRRQAPISLLIPTLKKLVSD